jgi:hypothetical protein
MEDISNLCCSWKTLIDECVEMVKLGKKIYAEGEVKDIMNRKRKLLEEDLDLDILFNFWCEM